MASNHTTGQPNDGAMLQLEGVSTFYGPIQALDDVSLVVKQRRRQDHPADDRLRQPARCHRPHPL